MIAKIEMEEKEMKAMYGQVEEKGKFLMRLGKKVKRSPHTVRMWFSDSPLTSDMPSDEKTLRKIQRELEKAKKL